MVELPHPWGAYARLQEQLAHRSRVDSRAWSIEAGLNNPLEQELPTVEDIDRTVQSASRKERHRAQLRLVYPTTFVRLSSDVTASLAARRSLHRIRAKVTRDEWRLLLAVGEGHEYRDIAERLKVKAGALRARVLRLRRVLSSESVPQLLAS